MGPNQRKTAASRQILVNPGWSRAAYTSQKVTNYWRAKPLLFVNVSYGLLRQEIDGWMSLLVPLNHLWNHILAMPGVTSDTGHEVMAKHARQDHASVLNLRVPRHKKGHHPQQNHGRRMNNGWLHNSGSQPMQLSIALHSSPVRFGDSC